MKQYMETCPEIGRITREQLKIMIKQMLYSYDEDREIDVIPTGISVESFTEKPGEKWIRSKKKEYGIPEENFVLLYVGSLAKEKTLMNCWIL